MKKILFTIIILTFSFLECYSEEKNYSKEMREIVDRIVSNPDSLESIIKNSIFYDSLHNKEFISINPQISLIDKYISFKIKIYNNTKEEIIIPLYQWGFPFQTDNRIRIKYGIPTYLINSIENYNPNAWIDSMRMIDGDFKELSFQNLPKFLKIDINETKEIDIKIDTLSYSKIIKNNFFDNFEFRISIADVDVLYGLFRIMKLNIDDYLVDDNKIELILKNDKRNLFVCEKYNSGKKLKGIFQNLIRLPFMKYIEFSGTIEK